MTNEGYAGFRSPGPSARPRRTGRESAVAAESGRPLAEVPGVTETRCSVITLAELTVGVLMATDANRTPSLLRLPSSKEFQS